MLCSHIMYDVGFVQCETALETRTGIHAGKYPHQRVLDIPGMENSGEGNISTPCAEFNIIAIFVDANPSISIQNSIYISGSLFFVSTRGKAYIWVK